jgi:hypothetical protein
MGTGSLFRQISDCLIFHIFDILPKPKFVRRIWFITLLLLGCINHIYSLENDPADTSNQYIENLTHLLNLRLYTLTKFNTLDIINSPDRIILRPNGNTKLGIGFNYKRLGLAIAFGRPLSQSSIEKYGLTNSLDLQVSMYGKRIGLDGFMQWYQSYYMANPSDFVDWDKPQYPQEEDLQIFSIGASGFYLFNSEKFSYRAAYLRNEIQKRSAGSFSSGLFFYRDMVHSENGFIPAEFPDSIQDDFDLKDFNATSLGILIGYQHTFVIKKNFFINLQVTPGVGYRRLNVMTVDEASAVENHMAWQVLGRLGLGYEFDWFYVGAMGAIIWRSYKYKYYDIDLGTEQFRFMIGKRFDLSQ